ncbi:MAG TPA: hypothetical protein VHN77_05350 [Phycisphaerales bacterium]|nr:hypothetical protein [Phycisphaerales bacterium]
MQAYEQSEIASATWLQRIGPAVASAVFITFVGVCLVHIGEPPWTPSAADVEALVLSDKLNEVAKGLIAARTELLAGQYASLRRLFTAQAILISTAMFVLLFARSQTFELKPIGYVIPTKYVRMLLPLAFLFVWMEFGFLFNRLIDNRVSLYVLVEAVENSVLHPGYDLGDGNRHYLVSANSLARDDFFVDNWFAAFRSQYILMTRRSHAAVLVGVIGFACFHGLAHACMLILASSHVPVRHSNRRWIMCYVGVLGACLLATHLFFRFGAPQVNWEQYVILASAVVFTVALCGLRRRLHRTGPTTEET